MCLSHPKAGARCLAHVCCVPLVTFTTLHLSPRPLLGLLGGPSGSKAQVAGRDSRTLLYFCNQRAAVGASGRAHTTCVLYGDHFDWFCSVFPYFVSLFKQFMSMANHTRSTRGKAVTKDATPIPPLAPSPPVSAATPLPSYAFCQSLYINEHICNLGKYRKARYRHGPTLLISLNILGTMWLLI